MTLALLGSTALSFVVLAAIFGPLERTHSARPGQRVFRPEWGVDLSFMLGQYLVWGPLVILALESLHGALRSLPLGGLRAWVAAQPVWLQVIEATALCDLLVYWGHRLSHQVDWLWRFHAVHHSVEHLDWLAAHREHPLDGLYTQVLCNLPALVLGISFGPLAMVVAFRGLWAAFIHSNVRVPLGPLGFLFGSPELHHWHHARVEATRHNFANLAPWVDWLFGTYHRPEGEERYALGLTEPFARGYVAQLLSPLRRRGPGLPSPDPSAR
ncbi:sterol desaturase family protein [Myxococcaceae bacterium GXIMD 01537]